MSDKPILFSKPMVLALLAGTKTQTRRPINTKPSKTRPNLFDGSWADSYILDPGNREWRDRSLRIAVGDRLYVRETFSGEYRWKDYPPRDWMDSAVWYWADGNPHGGDWTKPKPGIHMPRWASRITLHVTDVRVQRLQDCSEEDAKAEGVVDTGRRDGAPYSHFTVHGVPGIVIEHEPQPVYAQLWNQINGAGAWESNPWVAAYTFRVEVRNIDEAKL